jgi:uncharacterized membrane protein YwaF
MGMPKSYVLADKMRVIDRILGRQTTYTKESGLRKSLEEALLGLPYYQLSNLLLLVEMGMGKVKVKARKRA